METTISPQQKSIVDALTTSYRQRFGETPRLFRAPGRVNLIGEHTDYNDGFVMPAAIQFSTWVAIGPRNDRKVTVHSDAFSDTSEFPLAEQHATKQNHWSDYIHGVAQVLQESGFKLRAANLLVFGEVPIGAGLSSSAALEVSSGMALLRHSGYEIGLRKLALLCQRAENEFVGARCGIMDQFIACHGRPGHAIMLDCRSLDYTAIPLPANTALVICNTMVKHSIAGGEYNLRRAQCDEGVAILASSFPGISALRDASMDQLLKVKSQMPATIFRRCHHVISEDHRVQESAAFLKVGDVSGFGKKMLESHASLRDDFEVSSPELDAMVEIAIRQPGVLGARMTGGGFGGCTVNLVREQFVPQFLGSMRSEYNDRLGKTPELYVTTASAGVQEVNVKSSTQAI
jgi:galactokinase